MILVTGATGTIGRPLIDLLSAAGADVRAISRNPMFAGLPARVEVAKGDPSRPETIALTWRMLALCSSTHAPSARVSTNWLRSPGNGA